MRVSLSGFLFEDGYVTQSIGLERFCALAAELGCDGVELRRTQVEPGSAPRERAAALRAVRENGLEVSCLTARAMPAGGPERDAFLSSYLDLSEELGCRLLKAGGEPDWMRRAAERAAGRGVALAQNNHVGSSLQTVRGTLEFFAAVGHPNAGLLYDSFHLRAAGDDYLGCVPALHGLVRNILVHSIRPATPDDPRALTMAGRRWAICHPDDPGAQDWRAILGAFRRLGWEGWVTVIESGWPREEREAVARRNVAFLREVIG